jgi:putative acetyltransferase
MGMETSSDAGPIIRPIRADDDASVAAVIRTVMPEFGADGPGFAIHDAEVDAMSTAYAPPRALYLVVEMGGRVVGGGGVAPLTGAGPEVCELRKMYFLREARGRGVGRLVLERCIAAARELGYRTMYLETLTGMEAAQHLYEQLGFRRLACAMGATGHFSCDRYYALSLGNATDPG